MQTTLMQLVLQQFSIKLGLVFTVHYLEIVASKPCPKPLHIFS